MPPSRRGREQRYYALVVPGLEDLAAAELERNGARVRETLARFDKRDSLLVFTASDVTPLRRCSLVEDVFAVLLDAPTPPARSGPKQLAAKLDRADLERAMLAHRSFGPKRKGRSFRIVGRLAGRQQFRREDINMPFAKAIGVMLPHWVPAPDGALEIWVHVIGERTIVGLRLSGDEFAQRSYKRAHLPASLKPTVARALVTLSAPGPGDVVIDPL